MGGEETAAEGAVGTKDENNSRGTENSARITTSTATSKTSSLTLASVSDVRGAASCFVFPMLLCFFRLLCFLVFSLQVRDTAETKETRR